MTKLEYILDIKKRIDSEYKKHNNLDWSEIAANKIYLSLFPEVKECPLCESKNIFGFNLMHYKCKKCDNRFTN